MDGGAPSFDAAVDAAVEQDARDGSTPDAGGDAASEVANSCRVLTDDTVIAQRFFDPQSPIPVAVHAQGALFSWTQFRAGKSRVLSRWFGVSANAADAPDVEGDSDQRNVYSASTTTGFITTWSDADGLRARRTGDDGSTRDATLLANTSSAVSAQGADGNIVVVSSLGALLLGPDTQPVGAARAIPDLGAIVGRPALTAYQSGYLLAWVDAAKRRVHLQNLDATGAPVGASRLLDSDGDAQGHLDFATTAKDGAITWDVLVSGARAEVHLRTFDSSAQATGVEQTVTAFPETGLHPALVATRGGYLIAYRSTQDAAITLRLATLDTRGKALTSALTVASLQQQDLPLAMRMTDDGRHLFVGWLDQTPNTPDYQLQRTWIGCD